MILDERTEFADNLTVAGAAGTVLIGDVIDRRSATTNPNVVSDLEGTGQYLVLQTADEEVITAGIAGTLQLTLVSDALATLGGGVIANCTVHIQTPALVTGAANANDARFNIGGLIFCGALPSGLYERYIGVLATIGTTAITAGRINAFLVSDPALYRAYGDNVA